MRHPRGGAAAAETIDLGVYEAAASGADPAPVGHRRARRELPRAARPRRRARKRRGRLVLFGSAGVVLAAGALGIAQLALEPPPDERGAATSVHEEEQISQETAAPVPDASDAGGPSGRARCPRGRGAGRGIRPRAVRGPGRAAPEPAPCPGRLPPGHRPDHRAQRPGAHADGPGRLPLPSTSPQPSASDSAPAPQPSPTPTPTCNRFLWWCL
ncbi:hypothetical protein [Streptomyces sp. BPTC-684]|uniref:hypothetical protein n=1 Tax=Streptomyces sp. BPTC-684 TaxID=3043734 RepID=UPI0024B13095|nr:hypothetical protein [Streptomyces sp. BPTC-684]WHM38870.1 hypothetical protein QIY60_19560 [Streptomyces sp. BPTC-684]